MFKDKKRRLELVQYVIIAVLLASAVLLGRANGFFGTVSVHTAQSTAGVTESSGLSASLPYAMAVTPDALGGHCGVTHGDAAMAEMFDRFSASLGEALGSAATAVNITRPDWEQALQSPGVYFDFLYSLPLPVLAGGLGIKTIEGLSAFSARRLCLVTEENALALYFADTETNNYYRCDTALTASSVEQKLQEYIPNGAAFVMELTDSNNVDAYTLMEDGLLTLPVLTAGNPLRDTAAYERITDVFGLSGAARSYTETDGIVFVENDVTLRILNAGTVSYRGGENGLELGTPGNISSVAEAAKALCQQSIGAYSGAAKLSLSAAEYDAESDTCILCFDYAAEGIPLRLSDGHAVEMTVTGGHLQEATLIFRSYAAGDETVTPLPRMLALAAAEAVGGGEPVLSYTDNHREIELQWIAQ